MFGKIKLWKHIGFIQTLEILNQNLPQMNKKDFYKELNKTSYYNAFFRIKGYLLKNRLIIFNKKIIKLTEKGKRVYRMIQRFENYIEAMEGEK